MLETQMVQMWSPLCAFYQGYNADQPGAVFLVIILSTLLLKYASGWRFIARETD